MREAIALLKRRPDFFRLWLAGLISLLGDWLTYIAVSLLTLREGGGALSVAMVLVVNLIPHAVLAPIAGPLADRVDRRLIMIGTCFIRMVITLAMAGAAAAGSVWLLQSLLLVRVAVSGFYIPARRASLPRVVERDELMLANTVSSATWSVMFATGVALGGFLAALVGPTTAIALDALTFLASAAVLWSLPSLQPAEGRPWPGTLALLRSSAGEMREAWNYARPRAQLLEATLGKTPVQIASGATWVVLNLSADDPVTAWSGAVALGLLQGVRAIGTGVGPIFSTWMQGRGVSWSFLWQAAAWGSYLVCGVFALARGNAPWLLLLAFLWGTGTGMNWVMSTARQQALSPDHLQGRLAALDFSCFTLGQCVSAIMAGILIDMGASWSQAIWASIIIAAPCWLLLRRIVSRTPPLAPDQV